MTVASASGPGASMKQETWTERHALLTGLLMLAVLVGAGAAAGTAIGWVLITLWDFAQVAGAGAGGGP